MILSQANPQASVASFFFMVVGLLILGSVGIGAWALIEYFLNRTARRKINWTGTILTMLGVMFVLGLIVSFVSLSMREMRSSTVTVSPVRPEMRELPIGSVRPLDLENQIGQMLPPAPVEPPRPREPGAVWERLSAVDFAADVYPSRRATVEPLALQLLSSVHEVLSQVDDAPDRSTDDKTRAIENVIVFSEESSDADSVMSDQFASHVRKLFPKANVSVLQSSPQKPESGTLVVELKVVSDRNRKISEPVYRQLSGKHRCEWELVAIEPGSGTIDIGFVNKPWVESFDTFVSENPDTNYVVGYSSSLCNNEHEAKLSALQDAQSKSRFSHAGVEYPLIGESNVVDRFAQRVSRPYGDVWREAVLLEVPPNALAVAIDELHRADQRRRHASAVEASVVWMRIIGFMLISLVTLAVCGALNWLTQGYYRTRVAVWALGFVGAMGIFAVFATQQW